MKILRCSWMKKLLFKWNIGFIFWVEREIDGFGLAASFMYAAYAILFILFARKISEIEVEKMNNAKKKLQWSHWRCSLMWIRVIYYAVCHMLTLSKTYYIAILFSVPHLLLLLLLWLVDISSIYRSLSIQITQFLRSLVYSALKRSALSLSISHTYINLMFYVFAGMWHKENHRFANIRCGQCTYSLTLTHTNDVNAAVMVENFHLYI